MLDTGSFARALAHPAGGLSVSPSLSAVQEETVPAALVPWTAACFALRCTPCLSLLCQRMRCNPCKLHLPSSFATGFLLSLTVETLLVRDWRVGSRKNQGIPSLCIPGSAAHSMVPTTYCVALASGLIAPAPPQSLLASSFLLLFVCALPCHPYLTFQSNNSKL